MAARVLKELASGASLERPIFVVGVPRSATTTVHWALGASPELEFREKEEHVIWNLLHHPRMHGWRPGLGPGEVRRGERRLVSAYFRGKHGPRPRRLLDKAPPNSLRIPHLIELFPDAAIVVVRRNPPDAINGLIKIWRSSAPQFASYLLPVDPQVPGNQTPGYWRLTLPPGWRDLIGREVPEVALGQWAGISGAIEKARPLVPSGQWTDLYLENLLADPAGELMRLCERIGIDPEPVRPRLTELLAEPENATTTPGIGKWRDEHRAEIERLLPRIAELAPARGYRVDPCSGEFEVAPIPA